MKRTFPAILAIVTPLLIYAQNTTDKTVELWGKGPSFTENIIPPSPNAAQAARYADCPVSYCLGLPDISIPIYTARGRELSLPVTLSYHAGGIRVDDVAGVAGLGWNLDAGGVITREIVNMPDEYRVKSDTEDFFEMMSPAEVFRRLRNNICDEKVLQYFRELHFGRRDAGYDRYSYNFCGRSGSFLIDRMDNGRIRECQMNDFKIIPAEGLDSFTILAEDGTSYLFSEQETVNKRRVEGGSSLSPSDYFVPNAWYLTRIVSFNRTDTVTLRYDKVAAWERTVGSTTRTYTWTKEGAGVFTATPGSAVSHSQSLTNYRYNPVVLASIVFSGGRVDFYYDDENQEISHSASMLERSDNYPKKLRSIVVRNSSGNMIKRAEFAMDRFGFDHRLKLASLRIYAGTVLDETYGFSYHEPLLAISRYSQDLFGYLNAEVNTSLNFINQTCDLFSATLPRRRSSFSRARTFALKEFARNGVRTVLTYEPNTCPTGSAFWGDVSIGLRVASIGTYDGDKLVRKRNFEYEDAQCTIDFAAVGWDFYTRRSGDCRMDSGLDRHYTLSVTVCEGSTAPGAAPERARVCYPVVREFILDGADSTRRVKTEYRFDCTPDKNVYVPTAHLLQDSCIIDPVLAQSDLGMMGCDDSAFVPELRGYFRERPQFFDNLVEKIVYRTDSAGHYRAVSRTVNKYRRHTGPQVLTDLFVRHLGAGGDNGEPGMSDGSGLETDTNTRGNGEVIVTPSDEMRNAKDARTFYTFYVYSDALHGSRVYDSEQIDSLLSGVRRMREKYAYKPGVGYGSWPGSSSGGEELESELEADVDENFVSGQLHRRDMLAGNTVYRYNYLYPVTYAQLSPYSEMIARNNVAAGVGEELLKCEKDGGLFYKTVYKKGRYVGYGLFPVASGDTLIKPRRVVERLDDATVREQEVLRYDELGNVLEVAQSGCPTTCYLWGYAGTYPVAEIRNADYTRVVQVMGGTERIREITFAARLDDESYALLCALRERLPQADVTVWRHIPLVGLRDVVDPSGRAMHYLYDDAWRLRMVCDDAGEPVESYEYFKNASVL